MNISNSYIMKAIAASWLRYDRKCPLVTFERGLDYNSNPDVMAVNPSRFLVEIEIKISMSDFRADAKKSKWQWRERYGSRGRPKFFYYFVPMELVEKVKQELKPGHGLLTVKRPDKLMSITGLPELDCVVSPKADSLAKRVSIDDRIRLIKHQSGSLCGVANLSACLLNRQKEYQEEIKLLQRTRESLESNERIG